LQSLAFIDAMTISIRLGTPSDNPRIHDLISKITMPGPAELCFQRQPDFFIGAKVIGDEYVLAVAEDSERTDVLAGLTMISGRMLYINGQPKRVYYSGDTRVDPSYRRRGIAGQLFTEQKRHRTTEDLLQGIIIKGNTAPLEAAANMADGILFRFWVTHTIETSFIFVRKQTPRIPTGVTIRAATEADVPQMQAFMDREAPRRQGYPVYDLQKLMAGDPYYTGLRISDYALAWRGDTLIGMLAGWDQKAYKQTRVMGFKPLVRALRPLYNLYVGLVGGFKLPPIGGALNYLTLCNILIANDDPAIFQALIDWVMAHQGQRYDALATGVVQGDPLVEVPRGYKRQKLFSEHLWMSYGEDPRPGLDARPLYVELGRL
jgi:GNAT superfamily N-acetyltransferase